MDDAEKEAFRSAVQQVMEEAQNRRLTARQVVIPPAPPTDAALAQLLVDRLNEICDTDPEAMTALVSHRVRCGPALAAHPTVQIDGDKAGGWIGFAGLLNGLCGSTLPGGWPRIVPELSQDDDGSIHCIGFTANRPPR
jgi:hypothetical protein